MPTLRPHGPTRSGKLVATWALAVALGFTASGCGHPCRDLSDQICSCMPTREQQQDCRRRVQVLESQRSTSAHDKAGDEVCAALLDSCSCEALARGDRVACGLALD